MRKLLRLSLAVGALGVLAVPAGASAAGWNCSASALLGQPAGPPVAANVGATTCKAATAGVTLPSLPVGLQGGILSARTTLDGPADEIDRQTAGATGEVGDLSIGVPTDLPIQIPTTSILGVDITSALRTLVPVASGQLLGVGSAGATASGQCAGGNPRLAGSSHVLDATLLGQALPVNGVVERAVTLAGGGTIDPSMLDPATLPPPLNALPNIQTLLDALPDIPIPATVAQIKLTPGSQALQNGTLTQKGMGVFVAVAGQTLADLILGQASVSQGDVGCGSQTTSGAELECTTRKLALIDVLERNGYARLYGAADRKFVGKRVSVVSLWNGKTVARPLVASNGTFQAKGKLPPRALRRTNRARYQARIGSERSLRLKLFRRMIVTRMSSSHGKVTITGRVVRPLGHPVQKITIKRRVSCTKTVAVKSLTPDSAGRFSVTIDGPPNGQAAVYRLQTKVRKNARNPKLFPTFTLPRAVELRS